MKTKVKKKNFSSFTYAEAFRYVGIQTLEPWVFSVEPIVPSEFFQENLRQISEVFDLQSGEESKKLLIDAICQESLRQFKYLKIWKAAPLSDEYTTGYVDYLMAERKAYLEAPFLCIMEAKKDDFEQGLAQCLPAMRACQYNNQILGKNLDIYGIVTNGQGWQFYRLSLNKAVYGSDLYAIGNLPQLLGILYHIFQQCEANLLPFLGE